MADWAAFTGLTGVVLVLLLVLSHLTQSAFTDGSGPGGADSSSVSSRIDSSPRDERPRSNADSNTSDTTVDSSGNDDAAGSSAGDEDDASGVESRSEIDPGPDPEFDRDATRNPTASGEREANREPREQVRPRPAERGVDPDSLSTGMVLANVAFSQGLFALLLLGAAVYTEIPASALGIEFSGAYLERGVVLGTGAGIALYVANELGAAIATWAGFDHDEDLRELLAPDSLEGWVVLLFGVLPIIAVFEEFLFRAALIGALSVGFELSPWLLAVGSSIAFALGHGMQGSVGVVVTGLLGFVLAAAFIVTGSFLVVVVAHYLVNALEFVVHEGLEFEWAETLES